VEIVTALLDHLHLIMDSHESAAKAAKLTENEIFDALAKGDLDRLQARKIINLGIYRLAHLGWI